MQVHHPPRHEEGTEFFITRKREQNIPGTCWINNLPNDVIIMILSCLTLEEAVRTSVLSRRWRYLWQFTSGDLVFEQQHENAARKEIYSWDEKTYELDNRIIAVFQGLFGDAAKGSWTEKTEFVNLVNQVMSFHQGPYVAKLIIRFNSLANISPNPISDWICFAMRKNVHEFELAAYDDIIYDLDKFLAISRAMEPKNNLDSLTSFRLVNFDIKNEMIEYLLSNCPRLEQLSLKGGNYSSNLNIVSISLKSLSLWNCWNLKTLKICAKNLVYFEYMDQHLNNLEYFEYMDQYLGDTLCPDFCFENVPLLSQVSIGLASMISIIRDRPAIFYNQLEKLVLNLPSQVFRFKSLCRGYQLLPQFRCLKQLELVITVVTGSSLRFFVLWAMASPLLSTFSIQFFEQTPPVWYAEVMYRSLPLRREHQRKKLNCHKNLKLVKLIDFAGYSNYIEFALDLIEIAKSSLEKLIINPRSDRRCVPMTKDQANLLEASLPSGAELVIQTNTTS